MEEKGERKGTREGKRRWGEKNDEGIWEDPESPAGQRPSLKIVLFLFSQQMKW